MQIILSDLIADLTTGNYVERIVHKEWSIDENSSSKIVEYSGLEYFPVYEDLPKEVQDWLQENDISAELIFEERFPLMLKFESDSQAFLYQLRWG